MRARDGLAAGLGAVRDEGGERRGHVRHLDVEAHRGSRGHLRGTGQGEREPGGVVRRPPLAVAHPHLGGGGVREQGGRGGGAGGARDRDAAQDAGGEGGGGAGLGHGWLRGRR